MQKALKIQKTQKESERLQEIPKHFKKIQKYFEII